MAVLLAVSVLLLLLGAEGDLPGWTYVARGADAVSPSVLEGLGPGIAFVGEGLRESAARWSVAALGWLVLGVLLGSVLGWISGGRRRR
ncbi:hypothetical protein [Nocardioides yefusunii]|uniref:Uncharacterized protein n=1 Tax=Nocardioides yefusunii TaxID=2500546 RepID=A0ABW1QZB5_9ACTN|nr:hypothetical protein [Nocardioides yefusunii]